MSEPHGLNDEALLHLVHAAYAKRQFDQALHDLKPLALKRGEDFAIQNLYAVLLTHTGQAQQALAIFQKWVMRQPADLGLKMNLAWCNMELHQYEAALQVFRQILLAQPLHPVALELGGLAASRLGYLEEALSLWGQLFTLRPNDAQTCYNLGASQQSMGAIEQAQTHYKQALQLDPQHFLAASNAMFAEHYLGHCSPQEIHAQAQKLSRRLSQNITPYRAWKCTPQPQRQQLRIGVVSPDLHEHPVGYFFSALLCHIAPADVAWRAYSDHDPRALSPWAQTLHQRFVKVHNTTGLSDQQVAALVHDDEIDILLDLVGWTKGQRLAVFAHKPAPVQLSWLGYFASTGLAAMDGILADALSVPAHEQHLYTEKVWYLPHTRLSYDMRSAAEHWPVSPLPALKKGFITFACFQNLNKLNEQVLQTWGAIARQLPSARWYFQSHQLDRPSSRARLQARLAAVGIAQTQVEIHGKKEFADYMQAYQSVDLVLDTFPYPGGTTTLEALWLGVPTLSLLTPGMLGRQGQALLSAAAMEPDWVCHDAASYIARAKEWAQPERWEDLSHLRLQLRERVRHSPVFNTAQFAADWQALVREIWVDACRTRPWNTHDQHSELT